MSVASRSRISFVINKVFWFILYKARKTIKSRETRLQRLKSVCADWESRASEWTLSTFASSAKWNHEEPVQMPAHSIHLTSLNVSPVISEVSNCMQIETGWNPKKHWHVQRKQTIVKVCFISESKESCFMFIRILPFCVTEKPEGQEFWSSLFHLFCFCVTALLYWLVCTYICISLLPHSRSDLILLSVYGSASKLLQAANAFHGSDLESECVCGCV